MKPSILFVGKKHDFYCEQAVEFIKTHFPKHEIHLAKRGERFPNDMSIDTREDIGWWKGDYIISYLSPWIIPEGLLQRAKKGAINFHPGPPEYPGIGCTNFAIYNEEKTFGVTCHHMEPKVDTGAMVEVKRFPLYESDTVFSLSQRCYGHILSMFYEIMSLILNDDLPQSNEYWKRKPYTRKELDELCIISPYVSIKEIRRRVKAVTFPGAPGAYIEVAGLKFNCEVKP